MARILVGPGGVKLLDGNPLQDENGVDCCCGGPPPPPCYYRVVPCKTANPDCADVWQVPTLAECAGVDAIVADLKTTLPMVVRFAGQGQWSECNEACYTILPDQTDEVLPGDVVADLSGLQAPLDCDQEPCVGPCDCPGCGAGGSPPPGCPGIVVSSVSYTFGSDPPGQFACGNCIEAWNIPLAYQCLGSNPTWVLVPNANDGPWSGLGFPANSRVAYWNDNPALGEVCYVWVQAATISCEPNPLGDGPRWRFNVSWRCGYNDGNPNFCLQTTTLAFTAYTEGCQPCPIGVYGSIVETGTSQCQANQAVIVS